MCDECDEVEIYKSMEDDQDLKENQANQKDLYKIQRVIDDWKFESNYEEEALTTEQRELMQDMYKARRQARQQYFKQFYTDIILSDQLNLLDAEERKIIEPMIQIRNRISDNTKRHEFMFITLNAKAKVNFSEFIQRVHSFMQKQRKFSDYCYAFEQRSEKEEEFYGIHCHMLVRTTEANTKFGMIRRDLQKCFKPYLNVEDKHCLNMQIRYEKDLVKTIIYITGVKKGDQKQGKVLVDKDFHEKYDLSNVYTKGFESQLNLVRDTKPATSVVDDKGTDPSTITSLEKE